MADLDSTLPPDVFASACPSRETLQHLTGRWGVLTMAALEAQPLRFGEMRRRITGISDRMLSQTLVNLERDGMINRCVLSSIPPHVEYALTELGQQVVTPLLSLIGVVEEKMDAVMEAREVFDRNADAKNP